MGLMDKKLWFKAKRYGWGWYPCTWQGWAVLVMYIFALVTNAVYVNNHETTSVSDFLRQFFPQWYILTVFLIIICAATGEEARWRWGSKKVEMIDVLDAEGNKTGKTASRADIHSQGLWHRTAHVFMINSKHQVLLQLRAKNTLTNPSKWHLSAGGHIEAGQTSLEGAQREMEEEIGLSLPLSAFTYIGTAKVKEEAYDGPIRDNEYCDIYVVRKDIAVSDLHRQESEVADLKWIPMKDFQEFVGKGDPNFVRAVSTPALFAYFEKDIKNGAH